MQRGCLAIGMAFLAGCANGPPPPPADGGGCPAYVVPEDTQLATPVVSFKNDVMKVFNTSCGASTCHGSSETPQGRLFLGSESAMRADSATVYAALIGRAAELPSMHYVAASDPEHSYLMHKLDGDQCQFSAECVDGSCRDLMPSGTTEPMPVATRDTIRRWISQGAQQN
jgi:hypothetical protein